MLERSHRPQQRHLLPSNASSAEELFIQEAAAQRRSTESTGGHGDKHHKQTSLDSPKSKRAPLGTIEIPHPGDIHPHAEAKPLAPSQTPLVASDSGDSPDELQGEVTTRPPPKHLAEKHIQKPRQKSEEITFLSPSRKRSPSDIEPTPFLPSRRKKKPKRGQQDWGLQDLDYHDLYIRSIRFGPIHKAFEREPKSIYMCPDSIVLGEHITGGRPQEVLFRHVRAALQADNSKKVRLLLNHYQEAPGSKVDIRFSLTDYKHAFVNLMRKGGVRVQDKEW